MLSGNIRALGLIAGYMCGDIGVEKCMSCGKLSKWPGPPSVATTAVFPLDRRDKGRDVYTFVDGQADEW